MSFDSSDPRSKLAAAPVAKAMGSSQAQYLNLTDITPALSATGSRTWWTRGQNYVLSYTIGRAGEVLRRDDNVDEYAVIFPGSAGAVIRRGSDRVEVDSAAVAFISQGDSEIALTEPTDVIRLFTVRNSDLLAQAVNRKAYDQPDPRVAPLQEVDHPEDNVRVYRISDHPYTSDRFARIFTSSAFMINFFDPDLIPRDITKMSPHHHDDFEQCSIVTEGRYVHHLRYPWTPDLREWREDEHVTVGSPSVTVIPPPAIHTSQSISEAGNQLIDVFCPPRTDFSAQPGWVVNADDYPQSGQQL